MSTKIKDFSGKYKKRKYMIQVILKGDGSKEYQVFKRLKTIFGIETEWKRIWLRDDTVWRNEVRIESIDKCEEAIWQDHEKELKNKVVSIQYIFSEHLV